MDFEILSYNVRGIGNEKKRKKLFNYIKKHTSSNTIVCLQETHSTKKDLLLWKYQWHGNMIFIHGSSNQKGVLVAFRYGLEYYTVIWLAAVRYLIYLARENRYWAKRKLGPISVLPCQINQISGKQLIKQLFYYSRPES